MPAMWRTDRWPALVSGTGCPICIRGVPNDLLLDVGVAWVTAQPEAPLPGYVCLVAKRHVVELFDLQPSEGQALWNALTRVARGVQAATGAIKLNYEIHGNTVPHLHVHVYPRFAGDPFEGRAIDASAATPFSRSTDDLAVLRAAVLEAMADPAAAS
jgi:diadenosine tetraphosphate (Ap4A) HIT family hydrolase